MGEVVALDRRCTPILLVVSLFDIILGVLM